MDVVTRTLVGTGPTEAPRAPDPDRIRAFFIETQEDFHRWSANYNMHFGFWARGINPFDREAML